MPFRSTRKVPTELAPALTSVSSPAGSKVKAKGTGPSGLRTGCAESWPPVETANTSTVPLALVVTSSCPPLGVKPISPGEERKKGGLVFGSPRVRVEPGIGCRLRPWIRYPLTKPASPASRT